MPFVKVANVDEVPEDGGKVANINGREIALFKVKGTIFAIDNTCKHAGGPLGEGWMEDYVVSCPLHGWTYDVHDGKCQMFPNAKVDSFPVKVEGSDVFVDV